MPEAEFLYVNLWQRAKVLLEVEQSRKLERKKCDIDTGAALKPAHRDHGIFKHVDWQPHWLKYEIRAT